MLSTQADDLSVMSGNIAIMFGRFGWSFHDDNSQRYGQLFKFHGLWGVLHLVCFLTYPR